LEAADGTLSLIGVPDDQRADFWEMVRENISSRDEISVWWDVCTSGAVPVVEEEDEAFIQDAFSNLPARPWTKETWSSWTTELKEKTGRKGKSLFKPLRTAITGRVSGPDMGLLMPLLQKDPTR